ncbi:hypothetical protein ANCDUO_19819, partial [Ancylostoma duodenale]
MNREPQYRLANEIWRLLVATQRPLISLSVHRLNMCDVRAQKSGIALEAQQKIHGKYDRELAVQILEWVK